VRIDQTAVIGHPPEHRDRHPADPGLAPVICGDVRIEAYVTVDAGMRRPTVIGRGAWLMKHSHVGHDAIVGDGCEVAPGAVICGHAELGPGVRVGVNASVLPGVIVGPDAQIGAGAVVTKNVEPGDVVAGNPARSLKCVAA
jgi:UDP-N-acetylglucosamine acyltransferase